MASTLLLLLVAVTVAQAVAPLPCQGDPTTWCQDMATAARCGRERQCQRLWDRLALGDVAQGDEGFDGDAARPGRGFKCSVCTKVLKMIQKLAGEDPDEEAVTAAMQKGCRMLGRLLGKQCQKLVKQYQEQISEALQNGDTPQDICTAMGICKA